VISFSQTGKFVNAIEDNSFFIEEAYNQEDHVVQHISNFLFSKSGFDYNFTQEWPVAGLKHQLSYTIPVSHIKNGSTGFGDAMINYRYQLSYKNDAVVSAPRVSLILPTGNSSKGLGYKSWGTQANLPLSKRWSNKFINHFNAGFTHYFKIKDRDIGFNRSMSEVFGGVSNIWLASEKFNVMLEYFANRGGTPEINNKISYSTEHIVAPGMRMAIDIKNLQIVPGIAAPVALSKNNKPMYGFLFYLSFEHTY